MMGITNAYSNPAWRPLTVYAFDPSMGRKLNNYMTIKVPYEPLDRGPVGQKIAVIDYDQQQRGRRDDPPACRFLQGRPSRQPQCDAEERDYTLAL